MILVVESRNRGGPMESFVKLFGSLLALVYHCFDRIVILGYIPLLTRPENIVHFFRAVHHSGALPKDVLPRRTDDYNRWVDALPATTKSPPSGPKRASAKRITCAPISSAWSDGIASASTSSSRAWRSAPPSAPAFPVSRSKTPS